ncbi:hypothetical protein GW17_00019224 [Ensete ventricosum]|nr:hypothetical protein GW17_00019224 [Ensete ventricosum]
MLESSSGPWLSCNRSKSVATFQGELLIFGRGNLVWLGSVGKASLFASVFFRSLVGSTIIDACAKATVKG